MTKLSILSALITTTSSMGNAELNTRNSVNVKAAFVVV